MNKKFLSAAIAAALGAASFNALGAAILSSGDTAVEPVSDFYAIEKNVEANPKLVSTATFLKATMNIGASIARGVPRYIRLDLINATFEGTLLPGTALTVAKGGAAAAPTTAPTVTVTQGGDDGDDFVLFTITPADGVAGDAILAGNDLVLTLPAGVSNLDLLSADRVGMTYGLYETETAASSGGAALRTLEDADYVVPSASYDVTVPTEGSTTALVKESYEKFGPAGTPVTVAVLGNIKYGMVTEDVPGDISSLTDVLTTSTTLQIAGDFSAAATINVDGSLSYDTAAKNRVFINTGAANAGCATAIDLGGAPDDIPASSLTQTLAIFDVGNVAISNKVVCMQTKGVIQRSEYTASLRPVGQSNYSNVSDPGDVVIGKIKRDGTMLLSPFFTNVVGYVPRFYLNNISSSDTTFDVTLQSDPLATGTTDGNCVLLAPYDDCATNVEDCTLTARSNKLIKAPALVSSGQRCAAIFTIAANPNDIHGIFQVRNSASGDFDSYLMISVGTQDPDVH